MDLEFLLNKEDSDHSPTTTPPQTYYTTQNPLRCLQLSFQPTTDTASSTATTHNNKSPDSVLRGIQSLVCSSPNTSSQTTTTPPPTEAVHTELTQTHAQIPTHGFNRNISSGLPESDATDSDGSFFEPSGSSSSGSSLSAPSPAPSATRRRKPRNHRTTNKRNDSTASQSPMVCQRTSSSQDAVPDTQDLQTTPKPARAPTPRSGTTKRKRRHQQLECPFEGCTKQFGQKNHLEAHKRLHTGEKPFVCEDCAKAFTQVGHLIAHKRTHTGEKPFVCPVKNCNKRFTQSTNMRVHSRVHHPNVPLDDL